MTLCRPPKQMASALAEAIEQTMEDDLSRIFFYEEIRSR